MGGRRGTTGSPPPRPTWRLAGLRRAMFPSAPALRMVPTTERSVLRVAGASAELTAHRKARPYRRTGGSIASGGCAVPHVSPQAWLTSCAVANLRARCERVLCAHRVLPAANERERRARWTKGDPHVINFYKWKCNMFANATNEINPRTNRPLEVYSPGMVLPGLGFGGLLIVGLELLFGLELERGGGRGRRGGGGDGVEVRGVERLRRRDRRLLRRERARRE